MKKISCLIGLLCISALAAQAETERGQSNFQISQHSIDSGGGRITGNSYTVTNSIGQHDANHRVTGNNFSLAGGFRFTRRGNTDVIFKNGFEAGAGLP